MMVLNSSMASSKRRVFRRATSHWTRRPALHLRIRGMCRHGCDQELQRKGLEMWQKPTKWWWMLGREAFMLGLMIVDGWWGMLSGLFFSNTNQGLKVVYWVFLVVSRTMTWWLGSVISFSNCVAILKWPLPSIWTFSGVFFCNRPLHLNARNLDWEWRSTMSLAMLLRVVREM